MGPTPVFFMHPSQDDSSSRAPLRRGGSTGRLLLPLDLPGHPDSQPPPAPLLELQFPQYPEGFSVPLRDCVSQGASRARPSVTLRGLQLPQCSAADPPPPAAPEWRRHVGSAGWGRARAGLPWSAGRRARCSSFTPEDADMATEKDPQKDSEPEGLSAT